MTSNTLSTGTRVVDLDTATRRDFLDAARDRRKKAAALQQEVDRLLAEADGFDERAEALRSTK